MIGPLPVDPYMDDPEFDAWITAQMARGDLAGAPDALKCYQCPGAPVWPVIALAGITRGYDPTQRYRLACGHIVI